LLSRSVGEDTIVVKISNRPSKRQRVTRWKIVFKAGKK
jgi:hypothetical protein